MTRRTSLALACATFALGLSVLVYRGPGHDFVRGSLGDGLASAFLFFLAHAVLGWRARWPRALAVLAVGATLELAQWAGATPAPGATGLAATAVGTTFDPWDLVAYAVGLLVALAITPARRSSGTSP